MTRIAPPHPTERTLTQMVEREITLPNGRVMRLSLSAWHWKMLAFFDLWDERFKREAGLLYEFHKRLPNVEDRRFAEAVMTVLRDDYNTMMKGSTPDNPPFHEI